MYVANGGSGAWSLPEPKGADTAGSDEVYIADGAGSGAWGPISNTSTSPTGWEYYKDGAAAQSFGTTASRLSIDGVTSEITTYQPSGVTNMWDVTTDEILATGLGDSYLIRLDLPVTAKGGSPNKLVLQMDIGGGATPSNVIVSREIGVSGTPPYDVSVSYGFFSLSTFVANNAQFFLNTDAGTIDITQPAIFIQRISGAVL